MRPLDSKHIQRINDKLDLIVRYHEELMEDLPSQATFRRNRISRRAVEKTIELIADSIVDVVMMIISGKGLERPPEARESITTLSKYGLLPEKLAQQIKELIGLRNLLVHQYAKVDEDREFHDIEEDHQDVLEFVREMEKLLRKEKIKEKSQKKFPRSFK